MSTRAAACILLSLMSSGVVQAQEGQVPAATAPAVSQTAQPATPAAPSSSQAAPAATGAQATPAQPAPEGDAPREGAPRWQYQSEQSNPRTYSQPSYGPSIAIEVEQMRNRVASLEDRTEKLERALSDAIDVINAQTTSIQKLSGN